MVLQMIYAATGHRPDKLGGYDIYSAKRLIDFATEVLEHHQPSAVITGMALGWDTAIAEAAVNLKIPFHAYIPFVGQELVWPITTKLIYKSLLNKAEKIVICSEGGFSKEAMQKRNEAMVDNCDMLLAMWNGSKGGTGNCLAYARSIGRPYINYWHQFMPDTYGHIPSLGSDNDWLTI
jgi:uncharacterized phage-like protein YoqJ